MMVRNYCIMIRMACEEYHILHESYISKSGLSKQQDGM